ncbi:hypothetical protein A2422_01890 [Candidatus Woesebacteria bacterium RIFOXYC1_FULL_31_51]|uniref:DUF4325 domain-containing protein n=1 Tax=Candidatus Woesebacteria bacterium GW2011_GWC2_31_9 TaxID=1618586 RepID=A0A0G0BLG2_9BACT|nr:MAG: hypothetical protein UR17_C0001G0836 [Candidatus Woesebacteria bacterium GW2011_GWF1_31_35]KKP23619.1 MAG: hypothetical protein UR11_C0001G0593 [Candidatus Woesebacteria bacterium GW2011_GWC1_30_29]KKP27000.1 MAG: hypothetical protein UR13_C0001G0095 [Candidatus Woesebacteria bacterium GW2011_GWD1_31_12]KKP27894.1 MAG: hypothetical protein UR16_C0002G0224 [Candidatus Woesebacteria bacterium GW2011_GWB1_31_29]KKP31897.1 MAG: hypothetical protein UR21_C0004G0033 [Candidatus Woesebacteria 
MIINLKKFGTTLVSRPSGKEAYLAFTPTLREVKNNETIEVDFEGVEVLTPSWADEFLTPLINLYGKVVGLKNTSNPSVIESLKILDLDKV